MYRGFKIQNLAIQQQEYYEAIGQKIFESQKAQVQKSFRELIYSNNTLDGSAIQASWFPQVKAHVFISHAHQDHQLALALAGLLYQQFQIVSFIDSCVWGYANDLLRIIDNKYCLQEDGKTYDYHQRNYSTANVHIMLSTALSMMLDITECIFFLNTPQSVQPAEQIQKTASPWIYLEIATTKVLEKKDPMRLLQQQYRTLSKEELLEKSLQINYTLDLDHLLDLKLPILQTWIEQTTTNAENALDRLYRLAPPQKVSQTLHS